MRIVMLILLLSTFTASAQSVRPAVRPSPPPTAPEFIPEAPVHGPAFTRPRLPLSPHKRHLPQTPSTMKEDGIWAGDESHPPPTFPDEPTILGVQIPFPFGARDDVAKEETRRCAHFMNLLLPPVLVLASQQADSLSDAERSCLAAQAQIACLEELIRHHSAQRNTSQPSRNHQIEKALRAARLFKGKACEGVDAGAIERVVYDARVRWATMLEATK